MDTLDKNNLWKDALGNVKLSVSPAIFSTWFSQTQILEVEEAGSRFLVKIGCGSPFVKNTIETRYFGLVQDVLSQNLGKPCELILEVRQLEKETDKALDAPLFSQPTINDEGLKTKLKNSKIKENFTFENFAVSPSNQMAHAAAEAVSRNPGVTYNPLFLWGGVGVGKTHLASAVAIEVFNKNTEAKVLFCTAEDFTNDIVEGIRNKTTQTFRNKYRRLDILIVDDIQFIAGKDTVQEEFFHTFNAVTRASGQIILTSDSPPSEISKLEERLKSRFEAGLIVDIAPPDFELRCAIIMIKAQEKGLAIEMDDIQKIAGNQDSARKIEGFLTRLISEAHLKHLEMNSELISSVLGKPQLNGPVNKITPEELIEIVCKYYSVGKRNLLGESRARPIARPRQVLMYLLRTDLGLPLEEVGRIVGGRDHTTVMHAVGKISGLASSNVQIREDLLGIKRKL